MAEVLISVLLIGIICQVFGQITLQPYGPKMCQLVCKNVNCTETLYDRVQLRCGIISNTSTTNQELARKGKERFSDPIWKQIKGQQARFFDAAERFKKACEDGNLSEVKRIIGQGLININHRWINGDTPVIIASKNNRTKIFDFLMQQGSSVLVNDITESNVLHYACTRGALDIVRKLLENHHFHLEGRTKTGATPLMLAVVHGRITVVKLLKSKGANVNALDNFRQNILHLTSIGGSDDMINYILSLNISAIERRDSFGRTPLHTAVCHGHVKVVQILMQHEADVTTEDNSGFTVFHSACRVGNLAMVEFLASLEELRGYERREMPGGITPIKIARIHKHGQIEKYLKTKLLTTQTL